MKKNFNAPIGILCLAFFMIMTTACAAKAAGSENHPYYLHALSDLRAARWMLEHRPGNWQQSVDEINAVKEINKAIQELKEAAIEDGKNIEDHPPVSEIADRPGRLHAAIDFLKKARREIDHEEDNNFANGLRNRSYNHIDISIQLVKNALHSS
jgi:hypothetical protein